jgi:hypothetical protein
MRHLDELVLSRFGMVLLLHRGEDTPGTKNQRQIS